MEKLFVLLVVVFIAIQSTLLAIEENQLKDTSVQACKKQYTVTTSTIFADHKLL